VKTQLCRDIFQVERFQIAYIAVKEVMLVCQNTFRYTVDRFVPLIKALDEPYCRAELVLKKLPFFL
jgi:hypothetical protein